MRRARRHVRLPPDLTSLFDVLFIVIFACLIRATAAQRAEAEALKPPPPRPHPPVQQLDPASLHARALTQLERELASRTAVIVRVAAAGTITALETDGKTEPLDVPLLEHEPDPDVAVAYLGDRSTELTVCGVAALHLGVPDLAADLVIIAPERPLDDLPHALYQGLYRDVERCQTDHHGLAVIVEPDVTNPPNPPNPPNPENNPR